MMDADTITKLVDQLEFQRQMANALERELNAMRDPHKTLAREVTDMETGEKMPIALWIVEARKARAELAAERATHEEVQDALKHETTALILWMERAKHAEARLADALKAGAEYITLTDPALSCMNEREEFTCGTCRSCWMQRAERAETTVRWQAESLEHFRSKLQTKSNCEALDAVDALKIKLEVAKAALEFYSRPAVDSGAWAMEALSQLNSGQGVQESTTRGTLKAFKQIVDNLPWVVDYWCRDCRDYFRAPHQPDPHAASVMPCPQGHTNTFEACRDDVSTREEDDSD